MKSARENHLWGRIFVRRDEMSEEESSLGENLIRRDEMSGEESSLGENFNPQG